MAGIYFHIPFCKQACYYCDFHFSTNLTYREDMVNAMEKELRLRSDYISEPVETIYLGGGTPSILPGEAISALLEKVSALFIVHPNAEITVEANPDDLTTAKLRELRSAGVNRLSIGVQSFDDNVLRFLNRAHDRKAALSCIPAARECGFNNISLDLIYAIPEQTDLIWADDINAALHLEPEHISAYSLTIEDKTVFGNWTARGKIKAVSDDHAARQMTHLIDTLEGRGYEQYEISNFAKAGFYSKHNSSYWKGVPYLGIGPGAHSYNLVSRQANISNNAIYLSELSKDIVPATIEVMTATDNVNDYLLTTLRTSWGTDLSRMKEAFGVDLHAIHGKYLQRLVHEGLAVVTAAHIVLTKKGRMVADKISSDLFITTSRD